MSRPSPPPPLSAPQRSSGPFLPSASPHPPFTPIAIATRTTYITSSLSPLTRVSLSLSRSLPLTPANVPSPPEPLPTYVVSSVRIYLSSVVRFRVIKLARAASLGFYLPEKKRINFERRRRFSVGTLFRSARARMCVCARARVYVFAPTLVRDARSFILPVLSPSLELEGE